MPGVYREEELDFAGTCVGLVARDRVIDGSRVEAGDVVLGLPSSGLHTNGFSLVRRCSATATSTPTSCSRRTSSMSTRCASCATQADVKALAHVTGGGILGNLTRVLPDGRDAEIDWDSWERPPVYAWLTEQGVSEEEQRRVFNVGIGMCAVVPAADAGAGQVIGTDHVIGVLVSGEGTNLQALIDDGPAGRGGRLEQGRRARARAGRSGGHPDCGLRARRLREPRGARRRDGRLARRARRARSSSARATCTCCGPRSSSASSRIVNTHSAPLPDFPGAHPIEDVLAAGVPETAATVHYVDEGVDTRARDHGGARARARGRHGRDAARARAGGRAPAAAQGRPGADLVIERALALDVRQDGPRGVRARARGARRRGRRQRRHGRPSRRARDRGQARRGADRDPGAARRAREDAPPAHPCRDPRAARPPRRPRRARRARHPPVRPRLREPLSVHAGRLAEGREGGGRGRDDRHRRPVDAARGGEELRPRGARLPSRALRVDPRRAAASRARSRSRPDVRSLPRRSR